MPIKNVHVTVPYNADPSLVNWVQLDSNINCEANIVFATSGGFVKVVTNCKSIAEARQANLDGLTAGVPTGSPGAVLRLNPSLTWVAGETAGGGVLRANIYW